MKVPLSCFVLPMLHRNQPWTLLSTHGKHSCTNQHLCISVCISAIVFFVRNQSVYEKCKLPAQPVVLPCTQRSCLVQRGAENGLRSAGNSGMGSYTSSSFAASGLAAMAGVGGATSGGPALGHNYSYGWGGNGGGAGGGGGNTGFPAGMVAAGGMLPGLMNGASNTGASDLGTAKNPMVMTFVSGIIDLVRCHMALVARHNLCHSQVA
jgi:hypothetical protein